MDEGELTPAWHVVRPIPPVVLVHILHNNHQIL